MGETKLEQVARAMAEKALVEMGCPELVYDPAYVGRFELAGIDLRKLARAAIEAMMEPSEGMLKAAFDQAEAELLNHLGNMHCKTNEERSAHSITPVYRAMLTAALNE